MGGIIWRSPFFANFSLGFLHYFRQLPDVSHFREVCGSSFLDLHSRVLRENDLCKSELHCFIDPLLETEYILDNACQGYFPEKYPLPERFVFLGGDDRRDGSKINPWLGDGESSGDIDIDIVALQFGIAPLGEDGYQEIDLPTGNPASGPFRVAELGIGGEGFYLDDDRTVSLQSDPDCGTGKMLVFLVYEL